MWSHPNSFKSALSSFSFDICQTWIHSAFLSIKTTPQSICPSVFILINISAKASQCLERRALKTAWQWVYGLRKMKHFSSDVSAHLRVSQLHVLQPLESSRKPNGQLLSPSVQLSREPQAGGAIVMYEGSGKQKKSPRRCESLLTKSDRERIQDHRGSSGITLMSHKRQTVLHRLSFSFS